MNKLNLVQCFPFVAVAGVIASFWQQSRNILLKIFRIFWKQRIITYDFSYKFYKELRKDSYIFDFDDYNIFQYPYYSLKHKKYLEMLLKMSNFEFCLYKKFIPILIFGREDGCIKIQYLKFTFNFDKFLSKTVNLVYEEWANREEKKDRFWIEEKKGRSLKDFSNHNGQSESTSPYIKSAPSSIKDYNSENAKSWIVEPYRVISDKLNRVIGLDVNNININSPSGNEINKYQFTKTGEYILSQVERWLKARNWYEERNINWKRGILLNGKPGNGKSSLILEIAKKVSIPLYVFDLSSMDNTEFEEALKDTCNDSAIILFEDFDNIFHGRNNITKTQNFGGLTFDMFINKLSGVNSIKNKFIFITTNHLEKVDSAVLRPGRIDEQIEILPLNTEEKLRMAKIILNDEKLINEAMDNCKELSTAEFENKCIQLALNAFWKK